MARQTEGLSTRMTQWLIVTEAALLLTSARIALWLAPFQQLMAVLSRPTAQVDLSESERSETRQAVRQGILAARRYLPFPTTCLHRAIAAHWMLRRRGVNTTLYYGVTRSGGKLTAHAWVQDGDVGVIGLRATRQQPYHVVARYPQL
jgi:hypothetical protein